MKCDNCKKEKDHYSKHKHLISKKYYPMLDNKFNKCTCHIKKRDFKTILNTAVSHDDKIWFEKFLSLTKAI